MDLAAFPRLAFSRQSLRRALSDGPAGAVARRAGGLGRGARGRARGRGRGGRLGARLPASQGGRPRQRRILVPPRPEAGLQKFAGRRMGGDRGRELLKGES